eukprot:c28085_g6_i1 orf=878-1975(-)
MKLDGEVLTVFFDGPRASLAMGLKTGGVGHFLRGDSVADRSREDAEGWGKPGGIGDEWRINDERGENYVVEEEAKKCGEEYELRIDVGVAQLHCESVMASVARFTVGYALTSKKTKSFLQPKFEMHARKKGISFVAIDRSRPLEGQGPFDVILHKISGREWQQQLEVYRRSHPDIIVLDPPEAIQHLNSRQSMLQDVADLNFCDCGGKVRVPRQLVVTGDPTSISDSVAKAGLKLPLVAKPLVVDGTAKSHALSLVFNEICLAELDPPLVLQEFVNHAGVLFKVYVVGDTVKAMRRLSLPDVHECESVKHGVISFPRVSCAAASADVADLDPRVAEFPPQELLDSLASQLRHKLVSMQSSNCNKS